MTQVNSTLTGDLQLSIGPSLGGGVEVPDVLLPVITIPHPLLSVAPAVVPATNLANVNGSVQKSIFINQGASSAAAYSEMAYLDRGIYRLTGHLASTNFSGPAASSASPACARVAIYTPDTNAAFTLCTTMLNPSVPQYVSFDVILHFTKPGWLLQAESWVATGVGQSIGIVCDALISKLV